MKPGGGVLDKALRQSIREGGRQHLTQRGTPTQRTWMYGLTTFNIGLPVMASIAEARLVEPLGYAVIQMVPSVVQLFLKRNLGIHPKRILSIVPYDAHPDRYVALNALTRVPGLIRTRK
jgi:hypothetical protein